MTQDVEKPRIANATTEPKEHEEIEITPEMIEAGVVALVSYNPDFELEEDAAARIFKAMITVSRMGKTVVMVEVLP
jgi:hypothetical protein